MLCKIYSQNRTSIKKVAKGLLRLVEKEQSKQAGHLKLRLKLEQRISISRQLSFDMLHTVPIGPIFVDKWQKVFEHSCPKCQMILQFSFPQFQF